MCLETAKTGRQRKDSESSGLEEQQGKYWVARELGRCGLGRCLNASGQGAGASVDWSGHFLGNTQSGHKLGPVSSLRYSSGGKVMGNGPIREELFKSPNHQGVRNLCVEKFVEHGSRALSVPCCHWEVQVGASVICVLM